MSDRTVAESILLEKRILMGVSTGQLLGLLLWVVAVSTDHWTEVSGVSEGVGMFHAPTQRYFLHASTGIWRTCRIEFSNATKPAIFYDACRNVELLPQPGVTASSAVLDKRRTVAAFAVISCVVMAMGLLFSGYTFRETRYMYKRLAACCHAIACCCTLIVIEVWSTLLELQNTKSFDRFPKGAEYYYGYSFILAWLTFISQAVATITFAVCSRKRKKDKAPNEQFAIDEEPTIIGR